VDKNEAALFYLLRDREKDRYFNEVDKCSLDSDKRQNLLGSYYTNWLFV